ncbi:MAG TPA: AAA family ATPase [Candidatus Megaira endosymbiont of Nemacystus decipiens]|nr:AAA family ATPase [Candidatus Megaera endosymbiont of Nemacystus decipiens]
MAIQFARVERVSRTNAKNACCKGAYNARTKVKDQRTNVTYNFSEKGDNVYHEILLPEYVSTKFKSVSELMNLVEETERKKNSQLLKEYVLALPDEKNVSIEVKKEMVYEFINQNKWIEEGLGVQIDIHSPHHDEKNWHAHILVTTRRFLDTGLFFESQKARDLEPEIRGGRENTYVKSKLESNLGQLWSGIQNEVFRKHGLENRVDAIGLYPKEHVGPVRMRSVMNSAAARNEKIRELETEILRDASGLLQKVTNHKSVFTKKDLDRAVKSIEDGSQKEKIVQDALSHHKVLALYREDGSKTNYFTTKEVRSEEYKLLRLSKYVKDAKNVFDRSEQINFQKAHENLTKEQQEAFKEIVLSKSGLRILQGMAGVGKSYVLKELVHTSKELGVNIIGLAPTHKAREGLAGNGFEFNDTIKGLLFKLASGVVNLPKGSLIVVDEAGMVGNDDYKELLRIAVVRKCNLILAGDAKQLTSVQRGAMFEVFAERYGSSVILDIKRQSNSWGREVTRAMSVGHVRTAMAILEKNKRIHWKSDSCSTMGSLLCDWSKSAYKLEDRVILAVTNKDVAALNHGAREYLKRVGRLSGDEIMVAGNHYMKGDKVLITKSNKELGLVNGNIAEITNVSENSFSIRLEGKVELSEKEIDFDPAIYKGFKHRYAITIFKSQGDSIKDVYIYHDGLGWVRSSYVALSRSIRELNMYVNGEKTNSINMLVKQLSYDEEFSSSICYLTLDEVQGLQMEHELASSNSKIVRGINKFIDFVGSSAIKISDKYIPSYKYYNYKGEEQKQWPVEKVITQVYDEIEAEKKEIMSAGSLCLENKKTLQGSKADYGDNRTLWNEQQQMLRQEVKFKAEYVARELLGEPNKRLSTQANLRFGESGKIVVRVIGEKAGVWYDFAKCEGGDLFDLVQSIRGGDFSSAAKYLEEIVGVNRLLDINDNLRLVYENRARDRLESFIKNKIHREKQDAKKALYVSKLIDRSKKITKSTVAYNYLSKKRGVDTELTDDIKTCSIYVSEKKSYLPALVVFARNKDGKITGGQQILLGKKTNNKADVLIPKKSFGNISGSFVNLGIINDESGSKKKESFTIIAEGVETGLSIKKSLSEHLQTGSSHSIKVLCSLGISNIKNYAPYKNENVIIAADNDGNKSKTLKLVENIKMSLEEKGASTELVMPGAEGDYNDVLKKEGSREVAKRFSRMIKSFAQKQKNLEEAKKYEMSNHEIRHDIL